mmetsp:Transcript_23211/g.68609  ORF Transcript_23211/g.68609 Transcript_23211/m.68609 type:complete len:405 (+) Transcript_23211:1513-2727(+)
MEDAHRTGEGPVQGTQHPPPGRTYQPSRPGERGVAREFPAESEHPHGHRQSRPRIPRSGVHQDRRRRGRNLQRVRRQLLPFPQAEEGAHGRVAGRLRRPGEEDQGGTAVDQQVQDQAAPGHQATAGEIGQAHEIEGLRPETSVLRQTLPIPIPRRSPPQPGSRRGEGTQSRVRERRVQEDPLRRRRTVHREERSDRRTGTERIRQVHPPPHTHEPRGARRGVRRDCGAERRRELLRAESGGCARSGQERHRDDSGIVERAVVQRAPCAPGPVSVQGRRRGEEGVQPVRRGEGAAVPRMHDAPAGEPLDPRRADEPSGHTRQGDARGGPPTLPGVRVRHLPRPILHQPRRHHHRRHRGPKAHEVRRRLQVLHGQIEVRQGEGRGAVRQGGRPYWGRSRHRSGRAR